MSTNNICWYKAINKSTRSLILKTKKLLDCALIGVCEVIRSNTVDSYSSHACTKSHPGICSPLVHSLVSNDSVSVQ